ncbi:hypothetical protein ZWY2020_016707 [Hordeum vulgare]|nr:hypothetical protein ZWY2020_016707 [Hordeum vulgare]
MATPPSIPCEAELSMYLRWWPPLAVHPLRWREAPPDLPTASFPPQALGDVSELKKELADKEHQLSVKPTEKAADNELSWLNVLSQETGENVWERINLQKALFELEETNKRNRMELQHLDDAIARPQVNEKDYALFQALTSRRHVILDNICDNDEAGASY